ncbi:MAG: DegV family protein [Caldiserica bacterium]|jgi:DegV family protein with EDD domain|nr:DegV family protein [Caldisericota bacterium]
MAIHIVTDSTACLPQGYAEEHGVTVIPLKVSVDGEYFRDGIDIANDEFYRRLVAGAKAGSTQPSPEEFASAYRAILDKDPEGDIISLHISSRMSGTLNSALTGRNQLDTVHVQFVDTLNAALGVGFPAMRAVELAEAGAPLAQVIAEVEALVQRTHTYFVLDSLTYLERGGRIGKAAAIAASILKIKPVLTYIDGVTDVMDRPRTKKVALERLWAIIDKHMQKGVEYVGFHYGANRTEVEGFQREFTSRYNVPSILTQLGPVVGTYSGPDMIGIVIVEKKSQ